MLLECLYVSVWATNLSIVAANSNNPWAWNICLFLPIPINFYMLKKILFLSSMLKSVIKIDRDATAAQCEEVH
jgi:hypothetical protein